MSSIAKVKEAYGRLTDEWGSYDKARKTAESPSADEIARNGLKQACNNLKERAKNLSEEARRLGERL
ncbi:MAG: hypothetical protein Q8P16_02705 [bacterium]|nr:hypothetical protein [bacterium]